MKIIYKNEPCPKCGNFTNRGISIDAVVIKDNKILLIKRKSEPFKDYWGTPGGYVAWDETVEDAVKRELKEETNLDIKSLQFVTFSSDPNRHPKQVINFVYLVKVSGTLKCSDDATDAKWFDLAALPDKLAFDHKENIKMTIPLLTK